MFRQIIVAMAGAIAAQVTAATLTFTPADSHDHHSYETPSAAVRFAILPGASHDLFAMPTMASNVSPFLSPLQTGGREMGP